MRPFEVLFLTNFSDLCFRAIPAVAQMSDELDLRLTIMHAAPASTDAPGLEDNLRNFFPEADHFSACRRLLERASVADAVRKVCDTQPIDLIVAPAGDPLGMPRLGHDSVRYRLMHEGRVPVWTHGPGAQPRKLVRPTRSVACIIDPERPGRAHLRSAAHYAARLGATLHVIESISDLFDEGKLLLLAYSAIDREQIADQIRREVADTALVPEVHLVTAGRVCDALVRLDADVVFLDGPRWTSRRWWRRRVSKVVDALPCPAICLDADRDSQPWPLRRPVRLSELEEMQLPGVARVNAFADESEEMAFAMVRQTQDAEPGR